MVESKKQFYLYDRWYYLLEEKENKLIYISKKENKKDGNRIEIDKENNKINIIFISNAKTTGKLEINCGNSNNIRFHYSQYECQEICVNDEVYGNLIYELYANRDNRKTTDKIEVKFSKKRNLNKICYREPLISIEKRIQLQDIDFNTKEIEFFKEIIDIAAVWIPKLLKLTQETEKQEATINNKIKEIYIPETLQVYDRMYSFVRQENETILYVNNQYGITNLEIKVNPSDMVVSNIKFVTKDTNDKEPPKHIIQIRSNEKGLQARYHNCKKTNVYVNGIKLEEARIKSEIEFDSKNQNTATKLDIETKYDKYKLVAHPDKCNQYQDEETNIYEIYSNYHNDFQSMIPYIPGIYRHVQNSIFKEKELIKK